MADNTTLNSGTGGDTIATDDIGGVKHQLVKVEFGAANSATQVSAAAPLPVDGSNVTQPVSGTITANLSAADNAVLDSIQAAVEIIDDAVAAEGAALGSGVLLQGDDGTDRKNINVDPTTGDVQVDVTNTVTVDGSGVTQPVSGTVTANAGTGPWPVTDNGGTLSVDDGAGSLTVDGTVTADAGTGPWPVTDNGGSLTVDGSISLAAALPAGTNNIGDVDVLTLPALPAGTNNIGDVDVTSIAAGSNLVGDVGLSGARTSGGTTLYKNIDVDETEDAVKASAGQVYWIHAINLTASALFLKFYNATVGNVTVGTTVPDLTFPVPTSGDTNGAGFTLSIPNGIAFGTAITIAATTGVADNDSGAPAANALVVNLGYA